ncbi:MAG TPA: hypothetical protein VEA19_02725, partial [Actinomycetota bacterium]|nr:hypothetical protein [Actinomycetota bacterium]
MDLARASNLLFGIGFGFYVVAMVAAFHHLAYRKSRSASAATAIATLGAAMHLGSIVARGISAGRVPWGNLFEFISVAGFLAMIGWLILERVTNARGAAGFVLGAVVLAMGGAIALYVPPGPLVPALQSAWLRIHVVAAMLGSSLFLL